MHATIRRRRLDPLLLGGRGLADAYERLKAEGVEFVSDPVTFELTEGSVTVVFTHDPDGNVVELVDEQ